MERMAKLGVLAVVVFGMFANVGFAAEMKKVLILSTTRSKSMAQTALTSLEAQGFVEHKTIMYVWQEVSAASDTAQLVAQVQAEAPDVVLSFTAVRNVVNVLEQFSVPVITIAMVEPFVNADGIPTANVSGVYSKLQDATFNSYKFLQKVAPLKAGQQVIFLDNREMPVIPQEEVIDALQRLNIPLKTVVDGTIYEDWQEAILQYGDDPEVGWILYGANPTIKRDGSRVDDAKDTYPWLQTHLKKPSLSHLMTYVQGGILCGFGIDLNEVGLQSVEMAARVLQGEPINAIKAEYPRKVNIALNRKTATNLGIVFSLDVLNLANVIYDDYEGKDVIRK